MKSELEKGIYYFGGQIKMNFDDQINMDSFNKVREITQKRLIESGGPCNSWEAASINNANKKLEDTERIVQKYFGVLKSREN